MSGKEDADNQKRKYQAPYTSHNPIPTIQHYREEKEQRRADALPSDDDQADDRSKTQQAKDAYKGYRYGDSGQTEGETGGGSAPYQSENKITGQWGDGGETADRQDYADEGAKPDRERGQGEDEDSDVAKDTSQTTSSDPRHRHKDMKKRKDDRAEREVTDPVTHLPVTIHDFTQKDLKNTPENEPPPGTHPRSATSTDAKSKNEDQLQGEATETHSTHSNMEKLFPPPSYDDARQELIRIYHTALTVGLAFVLAVVVILLLLERWFGLAAKVESKVLRYVSPGRTVSSIVLLLVGTGLGTLVIWGLREWVEEKVKGVWETEVWEAERQQGKKMAESEAPESTQWLNSLLASVWPLINPDLFTSLADTLEATTIQDVMQASLPKLVRMVSVDDIGQGSESIRILGVKWLPTGAAAKSVGEDGKFKSGGDDSKQSDRSVPGQGELQEKPDDDKSREGGSGNEESEGKDKRREDEQSGENIAEGMEAEEGDFVNMEVAFAYRARPDGKSMRNRSKNAHLYLAFYLPGKIKFPVWVELHGLVGIMRLRLQLTPDPPFFELCTLTFLGQPKVDLSCIPLSRKGLNIMDLPLISNFVQSAVDAAMAEYVAPKSLTLDLKDMVVGDDFKKDTDARGVLVVRIKRAFGFKQGDAGMTFLKDGSADPYVSVGWAKFGKPVWSTRVIESEMEPWWDETAFILVTPMELNVDERLRVQLWDSDRTSADDDLGRIELDIKDLMRDPHSNGKMWDRQDGFKALKAGEGMPGRLEWSVGYYSKTRITESQLLQQTEDPSIKTIDQLKQKVSEESERKLREAKHDESGEVEQQKAQDFKARQDQLIISSPPSQEYPTGILSIQIHQITGLELEAINKRQVSKQEEASDEQEEGDDLPSSYCTIILNHQKIFKTRTKPKNSKPFFNAGCEKPLRDWRNSEIHIAVRDDRVHEDNPLLGVVSLRLGELFAKRAQVSGFFPLAGGIGYGRVRVSLVFRSIQLQAPKQMLGWEYGTLDVQPEARSVDLPEDLKGFRLKLRTSLGRGKMHADGQGGWKSKHGPIRLAVRRRYSSPLIIEFRSASKLVDKTTAFAVLWLKDIPDEEDQTLNLTVWKGDLQRAEKCCLPECGEKVGSIELKLRFWSGLSGYHNKFASKDRNLADVMEVLEVANENIESGDETDTGSGSDSDSKGSDSTKPTLYDGEKPASKSSSEEELASSGKRGPIDQIKDYQVHKKQLHRQHRGLMQWKGPRALQWMKHKVEHGEQHVTSLFKHHERATGIEREV